MRHLARELAEILASNSEFFKKFAQVTKNPYIRYMDIGLFWNRVKTQIKAHKLSQADFARRIGMSPATLLGWMYHKRIPDIVTALNIAAALGVSIEYLVFGKDELSMDIRARQVEERKTATARIRKLTDEMHEEVMRI